jgi:hypothetical protein
VVEQAVLNVGQSPRLTEAHISNFLNRKRALSREGLDRVLAAQDLTIDQILPLELTAAATPVSNEPTEIVPVVSPSVAMDEARVSAAAIIENNSHLRHTARG